MDKELTRVINLTLSTNDIKFYDENDVLATYDQRFNSKVGTIANFNTNITWNIDMIGLLGDTYNNYDYFTLELVQLSTIPYTIAGPNPNLNKPMNNNVDKEYLALNIYLTGLNFINSSYNVKSGCNNRTAFLTCLSNQFRMSDPITPVGGNFRNDELFYEEQRGYANYNLMFKKEANVNLNMTMGTLSSGLTYIEESAFPLGSINNMQHLIARFNIIPFK